MNTNPYFITIIYLTVLGASVFMVSWGGSSDSFFHPFNFLRFPWYLLDEFIIEQLRWSSGIKVIWALGAINPIIIFVGLKIWTRKSLSRGHMGRYKPIV